MNVFFLNCRYYKGNSFVNATYVLYSIFESFINNNIAFIKQFVLNVWSMNRYFYYYIYSLVFTFSLSFAKMNRKKGNHCSIVLQFLYSCCVYYCKKPALLLRPWYTGSPGNNFPKNIFYIGFCKFLFVCA